MARYTGPKSRIARKFGEGIFGADKVYGYKNSWCRFASKQER